MVAVEAQQFALSDRGQLDRFAAAGVGERAFVRGGFSLGWLVFGLGLARAGRKQEQGAERRRERGSHQFSPFGPQEARALRPAHSRRSEEHTSELQSLMRTSYAVFCLKKKKQTTQQ